MTSKKLLKKFNKFIEHGNIYECLIKRYKKEDNFDELIKILSFLLKKKYIYLYKTYYYGGYNVLFSIIGNMNDDIEDDIGNIAIIINKYLKLIKFVLDKDINIHMDIDYEFNMILTYLYKIYNYEYRIYKTYINSYKYDIAKLIIKNNNSQYDTQLLIKYLLNLNFSFDINIFNYIYKKITKLNQELVLFKHIEKNLIENLEILERNSEYNYAMDICIYMYFLTYKINVSKIPFYKYLNFNLFILFI